MKVAELYAELGFVVKNPQAVRDFESSLTNMAAQARSLVASLQQLAGLRMPRAPRSGGGGSTGGGGGGNTGGGSNPPPRTPPQNYGGFRRMMAGGPPAPGSLGFIGPIAPPNATTPTGGAAAHGLGGVVGFLRQLAGLGTLAYTIKKVINALTEMAKVSMQSSFATDKFGKVTGLTTDELTRWKKAASAANVSPDEMQDTLSKLAQQAFEIPRGFHLAEAGTASGYGIDLLQSADAVLRQFGQKMSGRSLREAQMVGGMLGISPNVAYMMHANKGVLPAAVSGQALSGKEQADTLAAAKAVNELGVSFSALKDKFVSEFSPAVEAAAKALNSLVQVLTVSKEMRDLAVGVATGNPFRMGAAMIPFLSGNSQSSVRGDTTVTVTNNIDGAGDPKRVIGPMERMIRDTYFQSEQQP